MGTRRGRQELTSGVADIEDVFVAPLSQDGETYTSMGEEKPLETVDFELKIKDRPSEKVIQKRTVHGPVLLASRGSKAVYSLKSSYYQRELSSVAGMFDFYSMKNSRGLDSVMRKPECFVQPFCSMEGWQHELSLCQGWYRFGRKGLTTGSRHTRFERESMARFVSTSQMPQANSPSSGL
ncbi:MAG: penicillin acylase family protein [Fimbriimonadaceae bacterium]